MKLANYLSGEWIEGSGQGIELSDPVTGESLVNVSSEGIDLAKALEFSRQKGTYALQQLSYQQRAEKLGQIADLLIQNKQLYYDISLKNSGSTVADSAFDIDGAIYTLKTYARAGKSLGDHTLLVDGVAAALSKSGEFQGQHFIQPLSGVAVLINAFNFPAWGLWEKAAAALLSGVAVLVKPATPTAWLTQQMVRDVVEAGLLPAGALNIVCGSARELLDHVEANDVVSFTGSAQTASLIRSHARVVAENVRVNIEADSVNSLVIGPEVTSDGDEFSLAVREIIKEMTIKSGQKCTAIRRIFVPEQQASKLVNTVKSKLEKISIGNPRNENVRMGPLVSRAQQQAFQQGLALLKQDAEIVYGDSENFAVLDADQSQSCFVPATLLLCKKGLNADHVHDVEVFGPLAVIFPYRDEAELLAMLKRGKGSLVVSIFSANMPFIAQMVPEIANWHGRIMVVDKHTGTDHSGHGNVMPMCMHGGPGRAGGGEELGGLRALALYHRRYVVQGNPELLELLSKNAADSSLLTA